MLAFVLVAMVTSALCCPSSSLRSLHPRPQPEHGTRASMFATVFAFGVCGTHFFTNPKEGPSGTREGFIPESEAVVPSGHFFGAFFFCWRRGVLFLVFWTCVVWQKDP